MHAIERHTRINELLAGIKAAQRRKEEAVTEYDALFLEYEALTTECYDESCPCTEEGQEEEV
jgi:hypothetical protein